MTVPIYQVDAFTSQAFQGNPAGVCLLEQPAPDAWMQAVAREMNLSETAFIHAIEGGFSLRWFTPQVKVGLCGHATLGTAAVLFETGLVRKNQEARFSTRSGWLTAEYCNGWIEMDFPARQVEKAIDIPDLPAILGVHPINVGMSRFVCLVEVDSEEEVRAAEPDFERLKRVPIRGVIVTSRSDTPRFDFVSRFFAPAIGINEDPVTGSAHCILTPFWSDRLGKRDMLAFQASSRGGVLRVSARGDRVGIAGQAVIVIKGELLPPYETVLA